MEFVPDDAQLNHAGALLDVDQELVAVADTRHHRDDISGLPRRRRVCCSGECPSALAEWTSTRIVSASSGTPLRRAVPQRNTEEDQ
jgi:hypothetical protein